MTVFSLKTVRGLSAALAVSFLFASAGCGLKSTPGEEKTSRDWYEEGMRLMKKKRYQGAAEAFREAITLYRDASLDAAIHIALGDTYLADKRYSEAVEAYQEFLRLHPRNRDSARAQYQIGMAHFKQMRGKDRSQEATVLALEAFEKVVRNYPRSELVADAAEKIILCRRRLAEHELYVGRYYMRTKSYNAALPRFDRVFHEYSDLGFGDDALYYLGLCYRKMKEIEKATEAWDRLIREYPNSRFLKEIKGKRG